MLFINIYVTVANYSLSLIKNRLGSNNYSLTTVPFLTPSEEWKGCIISTEYLFNHVLHVVHLKRSVKFHQHRADEIYKVVYTASNFRQYRIYTEYGFLFMTVFRLRHYQSGKYYQTSLITFR